MRVVRWLSGATGAVLVAAMVAGCRPELPQAAGIGDIAFRLQWEGTADLDLMVIEPSGQRVWFGERRSPTGGLLDVDCNFVTVCDHPIENVFWAKGTAPAGTYHYQVALANAHGATLPIPFTMSVFHGRRVVTTARGEIVRRGDVWGPMQATWRAALVSRGEALHWSRVHGLGGIWSRDRGRLDPRIPRRLRKKQPRGA